MPATLTATTSATDRAKVRTAFQHTLSTSSPSARGWKAEGGVRLACVATRRLGAQLRFSGAGMSSSTSVRHRRQDVFEGTPVLVGGGNWLYLTPGVAAQVGKGINAQVEVKVPVYRSLANRQLDSAAIFHFGVSRSF